MEKHKKQLRKQIYVINDNNITMATIVKVGITLEHPEGDTMKESVYYLVDIVGEQIWLKDYEVFFTKEDIIKDL